MGMDMDRIYVLHGRGGSPEGSAKTIADLLPSGLPPVIRPTLPHCDPEVTAEESYAQFGLYPNSLVIAEGLSLTPGKRPNLIALYSTDDPVIGTRANWEDFTYNAFNVAWMSNHDVDYAKHSIALFLTELLQGNDPREIVESIHQFPD
jgi:hypothetical protein